MYFNFGRVEMQIDETTGQVTVTDMAYDGEMAKFVASFTLAGETDGEVLVYVAATSDWQNKTLAEAGILALAGGTMAGDIAMGGNNITGVQLITLTPSGITGAGNYAIDINPSAPIAASSEFTGLRILGDSIDPAGTEAEVFGADIELSGVSTANAPEIHGARFAMPVGYDAIHIVEGEIHHGFTTGSDVAAQYTTHDIIIDASSLDAASQVHAIDVAVTGGTPAGDVIAIGTHSHVSPIVQETGAEVAPDEGLRVTSGPTYTANIDGQAVWVAKDDEIWFRYSSAFDEVEIDFSAVCSKDARLEFYYYNGTIWVEFFPADDTDGGRNDGTVRFDSSDFTAWAAAGDPAGASGGNGYWMAIKRTRVASVGSPAVTTLKVTVDTEYFWDATGNLSINSLALATDLAVAHGGTGASSAGDARTALGLGTIATEAAADYVAKALFNAQTVLAATLDDTPAALALAEQRVLGRITAGNVAALTGANLWTILTGALGANLDYNDQDIVNTGQNSAAGGKYRILFVNEDGNIEEGSADVDDKSTPGGTAPGGEVFVNCAAGFTTVAGTWAWAGAATQSTYGYLINTTHADTDAVSWPTYLNAGTYTFELFGLKGTAAGSIDVYFDADKVGTIDQYNNPNVANTTFQVVDIAVAASGPIVVKLLLNGKHASSTNHYAYLTSFRIFKQ